MERTLFVGMCRGGPRDGEEAVSRFPKGFLLVDKPSGVCWIYDWAQDVPVFNCRRDTGYELDHNRRIKAAEQFDYDVVAMSW